MTESAPSTTSAEVKQYQRQKMTLGLINTLLTVVGLVLLVALGPRLREMLAPWVGENDWVLLIATGFALAVVIEVLCLPLDFWSGFVLEHRYQLSNQTPGGWIWKKAKSYALAAVFGTLLLLGLYALIWSAGPWWWLWATVAWLAVTLILGQILPVVILPLFYKVTRLEDEALSHRLRALSEGTGLTVEGVYCLHLSEETKKANAALAGMGRTRRVLLGDTLLQQFTPEEIEVVFAHEVGHHWHHHLLKLIALNVVVSVAGFWLVDRVLQNLAQRLGYQGFADPTAVPLVLLVLTIFGLAFTPLANGLSRWFERQADRYALDRTANPAAYRSAFLKLAQINKSDLDPHPVIAWLFYDHPPIRQRLRMADPTADG